MKEKVNDLVRLHKVMQKKIKNSIIFRANCSEYINVFEYPVSTSHEIKKVGGILAKPAL